jgi:hypothetical protein
VEVELKEGQIQFVDPLLSIEDSLVQIVHHSNDILKTVLVVSDTLPVQHVLLA